MNATDFNNRFENQINILNEIKGDMTLKEYHDFSKENDPAYLAWLLGSHIDDYGAGMTENDIDLLKEFEAVI
jgi:hypothetical protein